MKHTYKILSLTTIAFFSVMTLKAQVKIGANPTVITSTSAFEVEASGGSKMVVDKTTGRLGVGTTAPQTKFQATGALTANIETVSTFSDILHVTGPSWPFGDNSRVLSWSYNLAGSPGGDGLHLFVPANVRAGAAYSDATMNIYTDNTGADHVGIGTINPMTTFHVVKPTINGPIRNDVITFETDNTTATSTSQLPTLNLVRHFPSTSYATGSYPVGGIINFGLRNTSSGSIVDIAQIGTNNSFGGSDPTNTNILFYTRTGVAGGDVSTGTMSINFAFEGTTAFKNGSASWSTISDARTKKDVRNFDDGLSVLMKIQPRAFKYNGLGGTIVDGKEYYGIVAQEIEKITPYMVNIAKSKDFSDQRSYDGTAMTYILINAVKEQQAQIEALKKENLALKAQSSTIEDLKAEMASIKKMLNADNEVRNSEKK